VGTKPLSTPTEKYKYTGLVAGGKWFSGLWKIHE